MTVIEKINLLKMFISQRGSCSHISCSECRESLFSEVEDNRNLTCKEMHEKLSIPFNHAIDYSCKSLEQFAKKCLVEILINLHNRIEE